MTRKQERKRRWLAWLAIMAAALLVAAAGWALIGGAGGAILAALAIALGLAAGHRQLILPPGVAILTYHSVSEDAGWLPWADEITVHPDTLERHLDTLSAMGCTVMATRDYVRGRALDAGLPRRAVILHFDDGYLDNFVHAVPALVRRGMPATFFVSLDFVEPGEAVRPAPADTSGYMNWAELRAIEALPGLEVEPHGIDHGRVPVSPRIVDRLHAGNWRRHAWLQWAATPGPKHDWFRQAQPAAVPLGAAVPESELALAARAWRGDALEEQAAFEARVEDHLARCRAAFSERLHRTPEIFCWPENRVSPEGRRIAAALGYRATTGGRQRNAPGECPETLSRIHMGDRALGWRWRAIEGLHLRAAVRLAQGNLYWYAAVGPMNLARACVMRVRRLGVRG